MHEDDRTIGRLMTRREAAALLGASAVAVIGHNISAQRATPQAGPVARCVVRPQQTEGPYFVDEKLLRSDIRSDPATGMIKAGAPLSLALQVAQVSATGSCTQLPGAMVDIWQCDAAGIYSDARDRSFTTTGQKFLRGYQVTDSAGRVEFLTIYPGWYPGRAVHIHFKVRPSQVTAQGYEFTSQFYFDERMTDRVFAAAPYNTHTGQRTVNERDGIFGDGGSQLMLPVTEVAGGRYAATFDLAMRLDEARPAPAGRRGRV